MLVSLSAQANSSGLPEGAGKPLVENLCQSCHKVENVHRSLGYAEEEWRALIGTMIDLKGTQELGTIAAYLSKHFPKDVNRQAVLVDGKAQVEFREWVVPTPGQRSRDPIEAPDGKIWWAGQWADLVGSIDPKTNEMREYALPAGAKPHSVFHDHQGNIWYTGNGNGTMGKLDPETEEITVFKMPDPEARDPHTAIVDKTGIIWFTMQHSNRVGRLDPKTGDIRIVELPTADSRPYGIKLDASDVPWIACNGSNRLIRLDPETMAVREYPVPDKDTKIRRLAIDSSGAIWFVNSSRGRIGRLDPDTGEVKEWPSPSGPKSHPYAIAVIDDIIWYNESGVRPEPLVRFDPRGETFQSWPIPSGGVYAGIVRHVDLTESGNLLIHQSATNRIIHVTVPPAD
jgi:virginiamycin B lyase